MWSDYGISGNGPAECLANLYDKTEGKFKCEVFAAFAFKYKKAMSLEMIKKYPEVVEKLLDVVTTSGPATGVAADIVKI